MSLQDDLKKLGEETAASCGVGNPREAINERMETLNAQQGWTKQLTAPDTGTPMSWGGKSLEYKFREDANAVERKKFYEDQEARLKKCGKWTPQLEAFKQRHDRERDAANRTTVLSLGAQGLWDVPVLGVTTRAHFERDPSLEAESRAQWAAARRKCGANPDTGWGDPTNNVPGKSTGKPPRNLKGPTPGGGGFWSKLFGGG